MSDSMRMELVKEVVKSNRDRMLLAMLVQDNLAKIINDFVQPLEVLAFDSQCACIYAKIVVELEKSGVSLILLML